MTDRPTADGPTLTDPESLADRDGVAFAETTTEVDAAEFADAESWDSHVVVGVADERGALLQHDGHHGWTVPAFPVADGDDWYAVARREFERLTGASVAVDAPARYRKRVIRRADGDDRVVVENVVVHATPDSDLSDDPESRVDGTDLAWFDAPPADAPAPVADDVRLVLDGGDA